VKRAVFVSGRGAVSCYGLGLSALIEGVYSGVRGVKLRRRTLLFEAPTEVAAEFPKECFSQTRELELPFVAGVRACEEALAEARVKDVSKVGLLFGSTKADMSGLMGPGGGFGFPARLAHRIVDHLGMARVYASVSTACTSGLSAIAMAARRIELGEVDRILVLGVDALNEFVMAGFGSMHVLDREPCRPFDATRRGISMGEGAAALVLSSFESDSIGIRIAGHGGANDAIHVSGCDRNGGGLSLAVDRTLKSAGLGANDVDFVHLHGTGTTANDASEAVGLGNYFYGDTPPSFGCKAQIGHTLGAGGALESLVTIGALQRSVLPANIGLTKIGVDLRLQLASVPVPLARARCGLKVASGFGGIQQAVLFQQ
jgi:3-oxoacyl-[acyl-carrier-protein] synthase I